MSGKNTYENKQVPKTLRVGQITFVEHDDSIIERQRCAAEGEAPPEIKYATPGCGIMTAGEIFRRYRPEPIWGDELKPRYIPARHYLEAN